MQRKTPGERESNGGEMDGYADDDQEEHEGETETPLKVQLWAARVPDDVAHAMVDKHNKRVLLYTRSVEWKEFLQTVAKRLYFSRAAVYVFGSMLAVNSYVLYRTLNSDEPPDVLLLCLEGLMTFMVLVEVLLRFAMQGGSYCSHASNLFDLGVLCLCLVLFGLACKEHLETVNYERRQVEGVKKLLVKAGKGKGGAAAARFEGDADENWTDEVEEEEEVQDVLTTALLFFRFTVQVCRMVSFALHNVRSKTPEDPIDFSLLQQQQQQQRAREDDMV
uniref:Ion transport domain-containing protein n=1 Tax=Chromera velia CCMP2878 TaxID=1169474 RepID=A0A0G4HQP3_9ALVE|eukprot:Cvel_7976.t1-p1 / transcript=Cvel_7976.t1 / gene=Cvel_7976 / organism=Chromera_velia_CCMP2878 / gene_product=hypothetical protein / transcript_product=hypothetical protein / location=Cvel_scaffold429:49388-50890(-) / protein_length=276 / sequence_SO=supercontig / SO=protein_coding / is_pseudo=false